MNGPARTVALPRELVLASAGSGKTFRISSRIIALLAHDEPPEAILASTFTRKAAGEILGRVLVRLAEAALDPAKARELAEHAILAQEPRAADRAAISSAAGPGDTVHADPAAIDAPADRQALLDADRCLELLDRLVRRLHRLNVSTLDAFFIRAARAFSHELGLPPAWMIADTPAYRRLRTDAVQETLRQADTGLLVELVRLANRGEAARSVHDGVFGDLDELLRILHELDPAVADPWAGLDAYADAETDDPARIADAIDALEPPLTKAGTADKRWASALTEAADRLRRGDWEALAGKGIGGSILHGDGTYYGKPVPEPARELFDAALAVARRALAADLAAQGKALGRLVGSYANEFERRRRRAALYRFEDVTRLLGGTAPLGARDDVHHRLDARIRHLLLDEFQDTSLAQWSALRPFADEILSATAESRAAVIVADPKQSIYGWRSAEPALVHHVGDAYPLEPDTLARSWRSSQVVLDVVNRVFHDIERNPALEEKKPDRTDANRDVAADWARSFERHVAARELPGYVRIAVGPVDEGRSEHRPRLLAHTAELVRELHEEAPTFSIGVLTRTNKAVARVIHELRRRGVHASEEGGNPLTDTASVAAVLSLLRLADHPGDRIARYHVARSPVGTAAAAAFDEVAAYEDHEDAAGARRLARALRRRLMRNGYGATLDRLAHELAPACTARELRRLLQLVELGFRHDAEATLRPTDFVRRVETEPVEDPTQARVRVMTVHQSKGLEFDVVVLPELDVRIFRGGRRAGALPYRAEPTGPVTRVFPYVKGDVRPLFPEVEAAAAQARASVLRDALSALYVAMTRARHALHIVVKPDEGKKSTATTPAAIVRAALAPDEEAVEGDRALFTHGDPRWFAMTSGDPTPRAPETTAVTPARPSLRRSTASRSRMLPRRTPSAAGDDQRVDLTDVLRIEAGATRERGSIVHAWCEEIEWIEDGLPEDDRLRRVAREIAPRQRADALAALVRRFREWMGQAPITDALRRSEYPAGATVERELPFAYRKGEAIIEGVIDRLVVWEENGRPAGAIVMDYKTDDIDADDAADARAERYRPQLDAYRDAVASLYGLAPDQVRARLLFVRAGVVVPV